MALGWGPRWVPKIMKSSTSELIKFLVRLDSLGWFELRGLLLQLLALLGLQGC